MVRLVKNHIEDPKSHHRRMTSRFTASLAETSSLITSSVGLIVDRPISSHIIYTKISTHLIAL